MIPKIHQPRGKQPRYPFPVIHVQPNGRTATLNKAAYRALAGDRQLTMLAVVSGPGDCVTLVPLAVPPGTVNVVPLGQPATEGGCSWAPKIACEQLRHGRTGRKYKALATADGRLVVTCEVVE